MKYFGGFTMHRDTKGLDAWIRSGTMVDLDSDPVLTPNSFFVSGFGLQLEKGLVLDPDP